MSSPGSFKSWLRVNGKRMVIPITKERFEVAAAASDIKLRGGKELITLNAIEEAVCHVFPDTTIDSLRYNTRGLRKIKTPRYFAYYLAYFHSRENIEDISKRWGNKNRATLYHGVKQVASDASNYDVDRLYLTNIYIHLMNGGYDIKTFVNTESSFVGGRHRIIEPVNIEI